MEDPAYPAARAVADTVAAHFARQAAAAREQGIREVAPPPDAATVEALVNAAFWASLRREEDRSPRISLALLPPERAGQPLAFERALRLQPAPLARLAPAVERPGIHLGVWHDEAGLHVWGATRTIPPLCFVLEVIEPGLLVIKYPRGPEGSKFGNVAVLQGDQVKIVQADAALASDCPSLIQSLLGAGPASAWDDGVNALVQLVVSIRAHGRGGSLLVVPHTSGTWRESLVWPIAYVVLPPFARLRELMECDAAERDGSAWQEAFRSAIEGIAGLTAVDGATVVSDRFELLAFGAKISRRVGSAPVERLLVTEPIVGSMPSVVHPVQLGGTRHLSAAQFVFDQRDALALVASQDGRFTVFTWSACDEVVQAHRVESLLL